MQNIIELTLTTTPRLWHYLDILIVGIGDMGGSFQLGGIYLGIAALSWALMSVMVKQIPNTYSAIRVAG